jgi:hypothetical protein
MVLWVVGVLGFIDNLSFHIPDAVTVGTPHLTAWAGRVYVGSHATAYITGTGYLEDDLTGTGIA